MTTTNATEAIKKAFLQASADALMKTMFEYAGKGEEVYETAIKNMLGVIGESAIKFPFWNNQEEAKGASRHAFTTALKTMTEAEDLLGLYNSLS